MKKKTLVVSSLILVLMVSTCVSPATVSATPSDEIIHVEGTVQVQKKDTTDWITVEKKDLPYTLSEGDTVKTGANSEVKITPTEGKSVVYGSGSEAKLVKDSKTGKLVWQIYTGVCVAYCTTVIIVSVVAGPEGLVVAAIICGVLAIYTFIMDLFVVSAFGDSVTVQTTDEYGSLIAQTSITGSLGLYPDGTAWAEGQQVSFDLYDGTISEPIEVSLSPSEAMELYRCIYGDPIFGGIIELPEIAEIEASASKKPTSDYALWAGITALATLGAITLIGAAWYIRRRRTKPV